MLIHQYAVFSELKAPLAPDFVRRLTVISSRFVYLRSSTLKRGYPFLELADVPSHC